MDHVIYTAMSAANGALNRQAVTAGNLANSSTTGFRAQLSAFRAAPVVGDTLQTRTLVVESTPGHDATPGPVMRTGRSLDVAMPQDGWLAVMKPDGSEAYTRNGAIESDSQGALSVAGRPLMGEGGPLVAPPQANLTIAPDGTVSALGAGDDPAAVTPVGRLKMVSTPMNALRHGDDGLFYPVDGNPLARADGLRLEAESLEGSNVSPVKAMTEMIATSRGFEMNMKVIRTADENDQKANQLLSVS